MTTASPRRAFSLVELLIVIIIIALLISILIPTIGGVRTNARNTASQAMMTDLLNACTQFNTDHGRAPGYFTADEMGHTENLDRGMSALENMMLDLAGGIVDRATDPDTVTVGPMNSGTVFVDTNRIGTLGSGNKAYYAPDRKYYIAQTNDGSTFQQRGVPGHTGPEGTPQLPDLVDAFGHPILAWVANAGFVARIDQEQDFARAAWGGNSSNRRARFYWASNAGFLRSNALGKSGKNQNALAGEKSLIGEAATNEVRSLVGALGNPGYPVVPDDGSLYILPAKARGGIILQSAGPNGFYFGSEERGARQFSSPPGVIDYSVNFMRQGGAWPNDRYTDTNGRPTNADVLKGFDDVMISGGN